MFVCVLIALSRSLRRHTIHTHIYIYIYACLDLQTTQHSWLFWSFTQLFEQAAANETQSTGKKQLDDGWLEKAEEHVTLVLF